MEESDEINLEFAVVDVLLNLESIGSRCQNGMRRTICKVNEIQAIGLQLANMNDAERKEIVE